MHVGPSLRKESFVALGDDALSCLRGIRIFPADDTEGRDLINLDLVLIAISGGERERERENDAVNEGFDVKSVADAHTDQRS